MDRERVTADAAAEYRSEPAYFDNYERFPVEPALRATARCLAA
jgi:hypothetical protein